MQHAMINGKDLEYSIQGSRDGEAVVLIHGGMFADMHVPLMSESSLVNRIASLSWCFGGGQSLQLALNAEAENPLAATALYYGNPVMDEQKLSKIKWPVLGISGDQDESIPVENVT